VTYFVDDHFSGPLLYLFLRLTNRFDGILKKGNLIRKDVPIIKSPAVIKNPLIKSQQLGKKTKIQLIQELAGSLPLYHHIYVFHFLFDELGKPLKRSNHSLLKLFLG
jgi:hypothetical protein